jgi:aminopeptidase N
MYPKGANLLQTLRAVINNDDKWLSILRGINATYGLKTCTTQEIEAYISKQSKLKLSPVFDQYLRHTAIPVLEYTINGDKLSYRWVADVAAFAMPIDVQINTEKSMRIYPNTKTKTLSIKGLDAASFKVDDFHFYVFSKKIN